MPAPTDAVDILDDAAAMLKFLIDVAPQIGDTKGDGLTADGALGLAMIMAHIDHTIKEARDTLRY